MLEQFSNHIRGCYQCAAEAKAPADATNDLALKAEFLKVEGRWLALARSYGFTESLEDFTTANSERRRKFDERLRPDLRSAPATSLPENSEQVLLPETAEQILWSIVETVMMQS